MAAESCELGTGSDGLQGTVRVADCGLRIAEYDAGRDAGCLKPRYLSFRQAEDSRSTM